MSLAAEAAARAYGLEPRALVPVASAYRPEAAWRVGSILLKPYRYGERRLYYVTRGLVYMERRGFPLVPRLIHSRRGEPYVRVGEQWFYATTWIEGRAPSLPRELGPAVQSLAAFHRAAEGEYIPWSPNRSWRHRWSSILRDLLLFRSLAEAGGGQFEGRYAAAAPEFIARAEQAVAALGRSGYDRVEAAVRGGRGFCHRDCTVANMIVNRQGYICLVDPDTWGPDLRLHDFTRLLLSVGLFESGAILRGLAAYEAIAPLDGAERRLLPVALLLPREFWWLGVRRYRQGVDGGELEPVLERLLAAAPGRDDCARELRKALG